MSDRKLVMIVDDTEPLAIATDRFVKTLGVDTIVFYDGLSALNYYKSDNPKPDAVLTDNNMPEMKGVELVQALRDLGYSGIVYGMSGDGDQTMKNFLDAGADRAYQKPVRYKNLMADLRQDLSPK